MQCTASGLSYVRRIPLFNILRGIEIQQDGNFCATHICASPKWGMIAIEVGAFANRKFSVRRGRIETLQIEELRVDHLTNRERRTYRKKLTSTLHPAKLLVIHQPRPANLLHFQVDPDFHVVLDPDERDTFIHPILFAIEDQHSLNFIFATLLGRDG